MRVAVVSLSAAILVSAAACASAPVAPPPAPPAPPPAPVIPIERKAAWILRLEQQRTLSDPEAGADLLALARDADTGVRRRAIIAIGRVGMKEASDTLSGALADADESVRASAAFALGLVGDEQTVPALVGALKDASPLVRGRAAQGLGLIGAAAGAAPIADASSGCAASMASIPPDTEELQPPEIEACRLAIIALVRLRQNDALVRVVLDQQGQPVSRWWPIAFALQRSADPRGAEALATLAQTPSVHTAAFALRGLASLKDQRVVALASAAASDGRSDVRLRAEAIRSLGRSGHRDAVPALLKLLSVTAAQPNLFLETVTALGATGDPRAFDTMLDLFSSPVPPVRAAAMTGAARMDLDGFLLALSSFERDKDFSVRANLVNVLATLPPDRVRAAVEDLADDADVRVQAPALRAVARVAGADADKRIAAALLAPDFALRAAAAELVGERRPADGVAQLTAAYTRGESDSTDVARTAALNALAKYPIAESRDVLTRALSDRDWPVRLVAASLLRAAGVADAAPARPAPIRQDASFFESERLLRPQYTPHAYLETRRGTIQIELNILDAPLTTLTFMELARAGFFNGLRVHRLIPNFVIQVGDPRGDGEGGPGYTIRDELGPQPFIRGTVGMALAGKDTGGSQFFIALSPQPHLEGQYTVFGRVVTGWEILDQVTLWDVIDRVRIWDGSTSVPGPGSRVPGS